MAIYSNLSIPTKDHAAEQVPDEDEMVTSDKVDPQLMKAIDLEIQKVKDSKFQDLKKEGQAQDSKHKDEDIKRETSGISNRRKTTKKKSSPDDSE